MDRHRGRDDRHRDHRDRERHHRDRRDDSRERNFSLGELKERARREMHLDRSSSSSRDHHHHRSRDYDRRRSRSRSGSPSNRHLGSSSRRGGPSHSPNRNLNYNNNHRGNNRREDNDHTRQQFNQYRNPKVNEQPSFQNRKDRHHHQTEGDQNNPTTEEPEGPPPEIRPNFELTGNLAKDTNTFNGVLVKYHEPAEAKKPTKRWRFYPFKGDTPLEFIALHRQSAYLFGRDRRVADVPVDHPSCSKQHAVLQFRSVEITKADGSVRKVTRPYIIDLDSGNGTFVNGKQVEARRYVELMERDVVKFGFSSREYVLLHDQSQNDDEEEGGDHVES